MVNLRQNEIFINVLNIINTHKEIYKKANNKKDVDEFFDKVSKIPLIKLYTAEGLAEVVDILSNDNADTQSNVMEFLLRLKPHITIDEKFEYECLKFVNDDKILDTIVNNKDISQFKKLDIKKEDISKYYILNLILVYNSTIPLT